MLRLYLHLIKSEEDIMKNLVICLLTGLVLIGAQVIGGSSIVFASPCIRLDYGEMVGHTHVFWCVDKGSIAQKGSIEHPVWNVTVEKDDENASWGTRIYYFTQKNGIWKYRYESWSGKGGYNGFTKWYKVSDNQLSNDILYIILN